MVVDVPTCVVHAMINLVITNVLMMVALFACPAGRENTARNVSILIIFWDFNLNLNGGECPLWTDLKVEKFI